MAKEKQEEKNLSPLRLVTGVQKGLGLLSKLLGGKKNPKFKEMQKGIDKINQEIGRKFRSHVASSQKGSPKGKDET